MAAAAVVYSGLALLTLALGAIVGHFLLDSVFGVRAPLRWKSEQAFDLLVLGAALRLGLGFVPRALVGEMRLGTLRLVELSRSGAALVATVVLVGRGPGALPGVGLALLLGDLVASMASIFVVRPRRTLGLGRRMPSRDA